MPLLLPTLIPAACRGENLPSASSLRGGCLAENGKVSVQVCLQARMSSYRLPDKILLRLGAETVLEHAMLRLRQSGVGRYLLLTTRKDRARLKPYADRCGFICVGGEEENVLQRFIDALCLYPCSYFIRATADNPLVFAEPLQAMIRLARTAVGPDYAFFKGLPVGAGVELVHAEALLQARAGNPDAYQREHVTPYLYQHPQRFRLFQPPAPQRWRGPPGSRITLDTSDDYTDLSRLFAALHRERIISTPRIIEYLVQSRKLAGIRPYPSEPVATG